MDFVYLFGDFFYGHKEIEKIIRYTNLGKVSEATNVKYKLIIVADKEYDRFKKLSKKDPDMIEILKTNPKIVRESEIFERYGTDMKKSELLNLVKKSSYVTESYLKKILRRYKNDRQMLKAIAYNPNTPSVILHKLSYIAGPSVLRFVVKNKNTTKETLHNISKKHPCVRLDIAKNKNSSINTLKYIINDRRTPTVAKQIARTNFANFAAESVQRISKVESAFEKKTSLSPKDIAKWLCEDTANVLKLNELTDLLVTSIVEQVPVIKQ
jgi:hypothetical protein